MANKLVNSRFDKGLTCTFLGLFVTSKNNNERYCYAYYRKNTLDGLIRFFLSLGSSSTQSRYTRFHIYTLNTVKVLHVKFIVQTNIVFFCHSNLYGQSTYQYGKNMFSRGV